MGLSWTEIVAVVSVSLLGFVTAVLWIVYGTMSLGKKRKYLSTLKRTLLRNPKVPMMEAVVGADRYEEYVNSVKDENRDKIPTPSKLRTRYPPNIYHMHSKIGTKLDSI